jgi:hypothetical protein
MIGKVIPLGYGVPLAMQLLDELMTDPAALLIDTRHSPKSALPQWRGSELYKAYKTRYRWAGKYLGNINYRNGGQVVLADRTTGLKWLQLYLERGHTLILLCQCPFYNRCHRKVIVDRLLERMPDVEVVQPYCFGLSLRQPWAFLLSNPQLLLTHGIEPKTLENRDWSTDYQGRLLIHASTTFDESCFDRQALFAPFWQERYGPEILAVLPRARDAYATGAIVGEALLVDVVTMSESMWFCGPYAFDLKDARPVVPAIPYRGQRKLFAIPSSLVLRE